MNKNTCMSPLNFDYFAISQNITIHFKVIDIV